MDFDLDPRRATRKETTTSRGPGEGVAGATQRQRAADNSPRVQELTQLQARLDAGTSIGERSSVIQRASFFDKDMQRYKTESFESFDGLVELARRWIDQEDKQGLESLLEALRKDIKPQPRKRSKWARANEAKIGELIELIERGGEEDVIDDEDEGVGVPAPLRFDLALSAPGQEHLESGKFPSFDSGQGGNQGDIHFDKHGKEFAAENKLNYIKQAREFGEGESTDSLEAMLGNTFIRVDPEGRQDRKVFVGNSRKIRTFYKWNPDYSSDPFGYAIYYTITHNMGRPIKDLDPEIGEQLKRFGVDLSAVENDYVLRALNQWKSPETISEETKLPVEEVELLERWAASAGLLGYEPLAREEQEPAQLQPRLAGAGSSRPTVQAKGRGRGLPNDLRSGVEAASSLAMDDVRVHYDSPEPAQLRAAAFARGSEIHLGPGQEQYLPHEAWHVVQQKQGRVSPTTKVEGVDVNDDEGLEREADRMGAGALQRQSRGMAGPGSSTKGGRLEGQRDET